MPLNIILLIADNGSTLTLEGEISGTDFSCTAIRFPPAGSTPFALTPPISGKMAWLDPLAGYDFAFKVHPPDDVALRASWTYAAAPVFFGRGLQADAELKSEIFIRIPAGGGRGLIRVGVCGRVDLDGVNFTPEPFCLRVEFEPQGAPRLSVALPDLGLHLPRIDVPWTFPSLPTLPTNWPATSFDLPPLAGRIGYRAIEVEHLAAQNKTKLKVRGFFIEVAGRRAEGNAELVFQNGKIIPADSRLEFTQPQISFAQFPEAFLDDDCFLLHGTEGDLNALLSFLVPELDALNLSQNFAWTLRGSHDGSRIEEIRIDIKPAADVSAGLPAFQIDVPLESLLHLVFRQPDGQAQRLWLGLTLDANATATVRLPFGWNRGERREVMPGEQAGTTMSIVGALQSPITIMAARFEQGRKPVFFKKTPTPLVELNIADPATSCPPTSDAVVNLEASDFKVDAATGFPDLKLDGGLLKDFKLPFLRDDVGPVKQAIQVGEVVKVGAPHFGSGPDDNYLAATIDIKASVGDGALVFQGLMELRFCWETMAFRVSHEEGIKLKVPNPPQNAELFGLKWTLEPAPGDADFLLLTNESNYQIKQVPESRLILAFDRATRPGSPIQFEVRNFALTPKGISLDAAVMNTPAKLAAIDTEFRFTEGAIQIRDNQIAGFTIGGSGALPPALVGPAIASIRLQFEQNPGDHSVRLISADARLQGDSLLKCESTRFQFAVTALGLKFVEKAGQYHLYFTLSGTARFVLASGDKPDGPLGWLPAIEMQMVECPLSSDVSELAKHIVFLIALPKPVVFSFLGCFEFELRAIGFAPQDSVFRDPKPAMLLSGQIKFGSAGADAVDARIDFHNLHIGLPAAGKKFPQLYLQGLGIKLAVGSAFELGGSVNFIEEGTDLGGGVTGEGFSGTGEMQIQGLPRISAGFAFLRVKRNPQDNPVRAWFLYLEASRFSLQMPVIRVFLREIGIGFGYRMTLAMIKSVDEVDDPKQLLKVLKEQAKRQGELARFEAWRVDLEEPGESPRWTIALRAMIAQNSAAAGATDWNAAAEEWLPNLFLLDVVAAVRSDLTILMVARAWFLTNYFDFTMELPRSMREQPLLTGFVLLSPRKKRLLANLSSNPNAEFGEHSPVPEIVKLAIKGTKFSATLLVEPGLVHYELGWPNQLRWEADLEVLKLQFCGGMIYRLSRTEFVIGQSFLARGTLQFSAGVDLGFVGARLSATASVAYGARYIGVLAFDDVEKNSAFYGGAGIEINVRVAVSFWIEIDLLFGSITLSFGFSFAVNFTASVEVGILLTPTLGVRGMATLGLSVMGHDLHFAIRVAFNEGAVSDAYNRTKKFLNVGLEAGDVEPIPGVGAPPGGAAALQDFAPPPLDELAARAGLAPAAVFPTFASDVDGGALFETPSYRVLMSQVDRYVYFLLAPGGEVLDAGRAQSHPLGRERGFLPVPPRTGDSTEDYILDWTPPSGLESKIAQADAAQGNAFAPFTPAPADQKFHWKVKAWDTKFDFNKLKRNANYAAGSSPQAEADTVKLREWLSLAFEFKSRNADGKVHAWSEIEPTGDPVLNFLQDDAVVDERVHNPADDAFEAAVRGAVDQFTASPYLKRSDGQYDVTLREAFDNATSLYGPRGQVTAAPANDATPPHLKTQQEFQTRSVMLRSMVSDFQGHLAAVRGGGSADRFHAGTSLACCLGLAFRADLGAPLPDPDDTRKHRAELCHRLKESLNKAKIVQRIDPAQPAPGAQTPQEIRVFNPPEWTFGNRPPKLNRLVHYEHEGTVAIDWSLEWLERQQQAFAVATASGGSVTHVEVQTAGCGYDPLLPPSVTIDPPAGATAAVDPDQIVGGALAAGAIVVRDGSGGYDPNFPPAVSVDPPAGGGQAATASVDPAKIVAGTGRLLADAVVVTSGGSGYRADAPPAVEISLPPGRRRATAKVDAAKIDGDFGQLARDAIEITDAGAGYGSAPPMVRLEAPSQRRRSEFDPAHHLDYYLVRRRQIDGAGDEREFRVKAADVLHRAANPDPSRPDILKRLKPRFQFVDHFEDESAEALAELPPGGRRYAYTIVPVDLTGVPSANAQTIVVRRRPATPPPTITESEFIVDYQIPAGGLPAPPSRAAPVLHPLKKLTFAWTPPVDPTVGPRVATAAVRLVFRRDEVLAIGQYAQDSDVGGPRTRGLAASNARPLRTDRRVEFALSDPDAGITPLVDPETGVRRFCVDLRRSDFAGPGGVTLPDLGYPLEHGGARAWEPAAWRVFVQTKSAAGVYSALAPVNLRLRFATQEDPLSPIETAPEERRPSAVEWLPEVVQMDMLPPRDVTGQTGFAKAPMPALAPLGHAEWTLGAFQLHPQRRRCLKMAWNQAGSPGAKVAPIPAAYPREYHAGYDLFEYDADARPADVLNQPGDNPLVFDAWSQDAGLRHVQRFEMLPADLLLTTPSDTADPQKWEAWYPSTVRRRAEVLRTPRERGSQSVYSPWFSWRESVLAWPDPGPRIERRSPANDRWVLRAKKPIHAGLQAIIDGVIARLEADQPRGVIEVLGPVPASPKTWAEFMAATNAEVDPYGWSVLQRLGLAASFTLRDGFGDPIPLGDLGDDKSFLFHLLAEVNAADAELKQHLYVELLYQPAKATRLGRDESPSAGEPIEPDELLAVVQLSLRPKVKQVLRYHRYVARFPADAVRCTMTVDPHASNTRVSVVVKGFNADQVIGVEAAGLKLQLERTGRQEVVILARYDGTNPPAIALSEFKFADGMERQVAGNPIAEAPFDILDGDSRYFSSSPKDVAASLTLPQHWKNLQDLVEALNPRELGPSDLTLKLPNLPAANAEPDELLAFGEIMAWLQRFFDHGGNGHEFADGGPWTATAYPRSLAVTAIAPHETTGLLEYCHPVEDLYAHAWRFFLRPSGRYDALWSSLAESHVLFRDDDANVNYGVIANNRRQLALFTPPPPGGLDLVLPRIRPLAAPSILFSGRLDTPRTGAADVTLKPPGNAWQVVLGKHAEQALVEKNRLLARRLAFRQLSVALMRKFQYDELLGQSASCCVTKELKISGTLLNNGDKLSLTSGANATELELPASDFAGLVAALRKAGVSAAIWPQTADLSRLILRDSAAELDLRYTPAGGASASWVEHQSKAPAFDEHVTVDLPLEGPLLAADESLRLTVAYDSGDATTTLPHVNTVAELVAQLAQHVPGQPPLVLPGSAAGLGRVSLHAPAAGLRLEAASAGGASRDLLFSRRPQPRYTTQRPELPGAFAAIPRRDALEPYVVESPDELRQLDLPPRLGRFGQGAVVYQWRGLPFYYQRLLLAVAQSTDVVSDITTATQRDFEYRSPRPRAVMDGQLAADGSRVRRIRIRLENLWSSLPPEAQQRWPLEAPETYSPAEPRPYSAAIDPGVIYQIIVQRPGGVEQAVSQVYYSMTQPHRYDVRNFPCELDGKKYTTAIVRRLPWGEDPARPHEAYLETTLRPDPDTLDQVVRAISSRHNFDPSAFSPQATGTAKLAAPADADVFPRASSLVLVKRLSAAEIDALEQLLALGPRDNAFRAQSAKFIDRVRAFHAMADGDAVPDIREDVSVGLDQLAELADDPDLVVIDAAQRTVTWASSNASAAFTAEQTAILAGDATHFGWRHSASAGATIAALLAAAPLTQLEQKFAAGEPVPTINPGDPLDNRLTIVTGASPTATWVLGPISATEQAALESFADEASGFGPTFRAAMRRLLKVGDKVVIQAAIAESDFAPRPTAAAFQAAGLGGAAGLLRGAMAFRGVMLAAEETGIEAARRTDASGVPLAAIDAAIARQLHNDALRSGFAGGALRIMAVRGSARAEQAPIDPYLAMP
jgi:hypothetical protein